MSFGTERAKRTRQHVSLTLLFHEEWIESDLHSLSHSTSLLRASFTVLPLNQCDIIKNKKVAQILVKSLKFELNNFHRIIYVTELKLDRNTSMPKSVLRLFGG